MQSFLFETVESIMEFCAICNGQYMHTVYLITPKCIYLCIIYTFFINFIKYKYPFVALQLQNNLVY